MNRQEWKNLVSKKGKINESLVLDELEDYGIMLEEVPKVYCEITGGLLSKPLYHAETVLAEFEDRFYDKAITGDDVADMIKRSKTLAELVEELKDYFELTNPHAHKQ